MPALFEDLHFQDIVLTLIAKDALFLRDFFHLIAADDFKPLSGKDTTRWTLATLILDYYRTHYEPIGRFLPFEIKRHLKTTNASKETRERLLDAGNGIMKRRAGHRQSTSDAILDFKKSVAKTAAINQLVELNAAGELTDEEFQRLTAEALDVGRTKKRAVNLASGIDERIKRRIFGDGHRYPLILVDPIDEKIRVIARSHLGVIVAPMKRGKSLALRHIAAAYAFQGLNVLYISLEDPAKDVEDSFDSMLSAIPIKALRDYPKKTRARMEKFLLRYRGTIHTYDGCEEEMTVGDIERVFLETQNTNNFEIDAVIIDYDDEIKASKKRVERRFEFADIYRELRKFGAKYNILVWTAAQTNRASVDLTVITEKHIAEDISKLRKCSCALSLGKHDYDEQAFSVHVMVHRNDRKHLTIPIMGDTSRMMFYDHEASSKMDRDLAMGAGTEEQES